MTKLELPSVDRNGARELEIEITPQMIKAGKKELMSHWLVLAAAPTSDLYEEVAISIFRSMHQSQLQSSGAVESNLIRAFIICAVNSSSTWIDLDWGPNSSLLSAVTWNRTTCLVAAHISRLSWIMRLRRV